MKNNKYFNDWRFIDGEWHYIENFPEANQMETFCQIFKPYGLFDEISKEIPSDGEVCQKCKDAYMITIGVQPTLTRVSNLVGCMS